MKAKAPIGSEYATFVANLKARIQSARISAARVVNRELIRLYWDIGKAIVEKQAALGWGKSVVEMLARDLQEAYPQMRGFSAANLWATRRVYLEYGRDPILQQLAEELAMKRGGGVPASPAASPTAKQLSDAVRVPPFPKGLANSCARILAYAQESGWKFISRADAGREEEKRMAGRKVRPPLEDDHERSTRHVA